MSRSGCKREANSRSLFSSDRLEPGLCLATNALVNARRHWRSDSREWAIRFAPPIWLWGWSCGRLAGEGPVRVGIGGHRALEQPVEEQPAVT